MCIVKKKTDARKNIRVILVKRAIYKFGFAIVASISNTNNDGAERGRDGIKAPTLYIFDDRVSRLTSRDFFAERSPRARCKIYSPCTLRAHTEGMGNRATRRDGKERTEAEVET